MASRSTRKNIALDTLSSLEQGFYQTNTGQHIKISEAQHYALSNTLLYTPKQTDRLLAKYNYPKITAQTTFQVTAETTMDCVRRLINEGCENVVYLNFASAKNAGGGFLGGSQAQEESIARATGLYPCLLQCPDYYGQNRQTSSCFYTDYMIYAPQVPILKDENGNYLDKLLTASVITAPAVNTGVVKRREVKRLAQVPVVMKRRMEKVLAIACQHQHTTLVLGAWGCGVFQNDPEQVAQWFREVIDKHFLGSFHQIVFAIYARHSRFIEPFQRVFS